MLGGRLLCGLLCGCRATRGFCCITCRCRCRATSRCRAGARCRRRGLCRGRGRARGCRCCRGRWPGRGRGGCSRCRGGRPGRGLWRNIIFIKQRIRPRRPRRRARGRILNRLRGGSAAGGAICLSRGGQGAVRTGPGRGSPCRLRALRRDTRAQRIAAFVAQSQAEPSSFGFRSHRWLLLLPACQRTATDHRATRRLFCSSVPASRLGETRSKPSPPLAVPSKLHPRGG